MAVRRSVFSWVLAGVCLCLSVAVVVLFEYNGRRQNLLQLRQQELNQGFLGPEAQQIARQVLEDMAASSREHPDIRRILRLHGYTLPPLTSGQEAESDVPPAAAAEAPDGNSDAVLSVEDAEP